MQILSKDIDHHCLHQTLHSRDRLRHHATAIFSDSNTTLMVFTDLIMESRECQILPQTTGDCIDCIKLYSPGAG